MDSFIEYMIKQRKTASALVKKILVYFAALIVSLLVTAITLIFPSMFMSLIPLAIVLIFYLAYRISSTYDVEFEYILTNGELDVDKITHKKRRKRLMTIHCKSFTEFFAFFTAIFLFYVDKSHVFLYNIKPNIIPIKA